MAADPLLTHAREFTDIEVEGLTLWNLLQDAGEGDLARELLDATLMQEHYNSLLPHLAGERSHDQLRELAKLTQTKLALFQRARDTLANAQEKALEQFRV